MQKFYHILLLCKTGGEPCATSFERRVL